MIKLTMDMMIAIRSASPNPEMSNLSPITASVINNVHALMTNKNKPSERTVTGKVSTIRSGLTSILIIYKTMLAPTAAPKLDTWKPSKYPANARNKRALIRMPIIHFIYNPHSPIRRLLTLLLLYSQIPSSYLQVHESHGHPNQSV